MSHVLDASAVIAIVVGEPGAGLASEAATEASIVSINLAEARDRLVRSSRDRARVISALDALLANGLRITVCDQGLAEAAADLRSGYYHRRRLPISMADCCAIAAAARSKATLVSSDADQLHVAAQAGVAVQAIPNSMGVLPEV